MNQIEEITKKFVEKHNISFRSGKKETFFADVKRSLQPIGNNKFRTAQGAAIADPESYLLSMVELGLYSTTKPSTAQKYVSPFPSRTPEAKSAHKSAAKSFLNKAIGAEGVVFQEGALEKVVDFISNNFMPADSQDGIVFHKVNDTPVGSFFSKEPFTVEGLINNLGFAKYVDNEATRISKLAHKAALRETAISMLEVGTKPKEVEKLVSEMETFEKRSLRVGKKIPYRDTTAIEREYNVRAQLNGDDRQAILAGSRTFMNNLDSIDGLRLEAAKIQPPSTDSQDYNFND